MKSFAMTTLACARHFGAGATVALTGAMMRNGGPAVGDYYVGYDDGYASWSPWQAFEGGYTRTGGNAGRSRNPF